MSHEFRTIRTPHYGWEARTFVPLLVAPVGETMGQLQDAIEEYLRHLSADSED